MTDPVTETEQMHDTRTLEALLFVSDEPLTPAVLSQAMELDRRAVEGLCDRLQAELEARGSGLVRLTKAALETLAIVAYKQPATRHQVSAIRGVNSDGVLSALVDRGLIEEAGRDEGPGRPLLYATTPQFLERARGRPSARRPIGRAVRRTAGRLGLARGASAARARAGGLRVASILRGAHQRRPREGQRERRHPRGQGRSDP